MSMSLDDRAPAARTSIVIAAHDATATLGETLDSVLAQTDGGWQALVVDDGSRDDTRRLVESYAARDARIVALQSGGTGRGAAAARNVGLAAARGRRVLFLDSDDWLDPSQLQTLNDALDAQPEAVAACCNHRRVMASGQTAPARNEAALAVAPMAVFARFCGVAIHAVLIERVLVLRVGGFDESLRTCEDWDLWQRIARLGGRWVHVDAALAFYRVGEQTLSHDVAQLMSDAAIVIGRGHGPDERLRGLDLAHPDGLADPSGERAREARACFALWCAGIECGRGRDGLMLAAGLADLPQGAEHARTVVSTLYDGVTVGMRTVPGDLAAHWASYGPPVAALINAFTRNWSDPVAGRRLQYAFERLVLEYDDLAQPCALLLTLGLRMDLRRPVDVALPPGIDRLYARLCVGPRVLCLHEMGALGTVGAHQWIGLALSQLGARHLLRLFRPALSGRMTASSLLAALRAIGGTLRRGGHPGQRWRAVATNALRQGLRVAAGSARVTDGHSAVLQRLQHKHAPPEPPASTSTSTQRDNHDASPSHAGYWEAIFQTPDPWNYGSRYEQDKYAQQLTMLPPRPIALAVELACAEGRFTEQLAPRVARLVAADISATALQRAAQRCQGHRNIEFRRLDLKHEPLPEGADLLICSEVLYYLGSAAELAQAVRRFAAALKPGGHLITAHAFVLKDDLSRTAFDWDNPYGARVIHAAFCADPQLALEQSLSTELYRIDCFVRLADGAAAPMPKEETRSVTTTLDADVARHIVWDGAVARRADVARDERVTRVPVLGYHRIADDGPEQLARYRTSRRAFEAQMRWLRRNGYHTLVSDELAGFLQRRQPLSGRPVMITFDDAYQDFADAAWPVLRRHDLRAEVFVVTDLAGGHAVWDRDLGEPARLMAPPAIAELAAEGVRFGSHLASHRGADGMSTHELAEELLRSRCALATWTGRVPVTLAAPFGLVDARLRQLALECGYSLCFGTESAPVELTSDGMNLPRVEVRGDMELDDFVACMLRFR
jgi:peptidoglycan/xylan/chitin deacetylase (PgdA/CDA1 family)